MAAALDRALEDYATEEYLDELTWNTSRLHQARIANHQSITGIPAVQITSSPSLSGTDGYTPPNCKTNATLPDGGQLTAPPKNSPVIKIKHTTYGSCIDTTNLSPGGGGSKPEKLSADEMTELQLFLYHQDRAMASAQKPTLNSSLVKPPPIAMTVKNSPSESHSRFLDELDKLSLSLSSPAASKPGASKGPVKESPRVQPKASTRQLVTTAPQGVKPQVARQPNSKGTGKPMHAGLISNKGTTSPETTTSDGRRVYDPLFYVPNAPNKQETPSAVFLQAMNQRLVNTSVYSPKSTQDKSSAVAAKPVNAATMSSVKPSAATTQQVGRHIPPADEPGHHGKTQPSSNPKTREETQRTTENKQDEVTRQETTSLLKNAISTTGSKTIGMVSNAIASTLKMITTDKITTSSSDDSTENVDHAMRAHRHVVQSPPMHLMSLKCSTRHPQPTPNTKMSGIRSRGTVKRLSPHAQRPAPEGTRPTQAATTAATKTTTSTAAVLAPTATTSGKPLDTSGKHNQTTVKNKPSGSVQDRKKGSTTKAHTITKNATGDDSSKAPQSSNATKNRIELTGPGRLLQLQLEEGTHTKTPSTTTVPRSRSVNPPDTPVGMVGLTPPRNRAILKARLKKRASTVAVPQDDDVTDGLKYAQKLADTLTCCAESINSKLSSQTKTTSGNPAESGAVTVDKKVNCQRVVVQISNPPATTAATGVKKGNVACTVTQLEIKTEGKSRRADSPSAFREPLGADGSKTYPKTPPPARRNNYCESEMCNCDSENQVVLPAWCTNPECSESGNKLTKKKLAAIIKATAPTKSKTSTPKKKPNETTNKKSSTSSSQQQDTARQATGDAPRPTIRSKEDADNYLTQLEEEINAMAKETPTKKEKSNAVKRYAKLLANNAAASTPTVAAPTTPTTTTSGSDAFSAPRATLFTTGTGTTTGKSHKKGRQRKKPKPVRLAHMAHVDRQKTEFTTSLDDVTQRFDKLKLEEVHSSASAESTATAENHPNLMCETNATTQNADKMSPAAQSDSTAKPNISVQQSVDTKSAIPDVGCPEKKKWTALNVTPATPPQWDSNPLSIHKKKDQNSSSPSKIHKKGNHGTNKSAFLPSPQNKSKGGKTAETMKGRCTDKTRRTVIRDPNKPIHFKKIFKIVRRLSLYPKVSDGQCPQIGRQNPEQGSYCFATQIECQTNSCLALYSVYQSYLMR